MRASLAVFAERVQQRGERVGPLEVRRVSGPFDQLDLATPERRNAS